MDARVSTAVWGRTVETARRWGRAVDLPAGCAACAGDARADGPGVTLITSGQVRDIAYATDDRSHRMEDSQLQAGEGPCTEAYVRRGTVEVDLRSSPGRRPASEALARMRAHASSHRLRLTEVALRVLDGRLRLEEESDSDRADDG